MVRGMPPQSGAQSAANGQSVRHGLDTDTGSGRARQEIHEGTQYPYDGRADELLDLSSLTERMSAQPQERKDDRPADENLADVSLPPRPLNLAAVRAQLQSKTGKPYWRTLEELAGDPSFEDLLHREFPRQAPSEWDDSVDRRDFLKLMAASLALAGLSGCGRAPEQYIVPYVKQPDGLVQGKPRFYATAMPFGADAMGLLVESHEGRPTKIEGNPDHPSSLGATNAFAQASLLDLYDPDRAQTVTQAGEIRTWSQFLDAAQALAASFQTVQGGGFRILTGIINSPTVAAQLQTILTLYPQAKWHRWEPAVGDGTREGAKLAFGSYVNTVYRPENADVILSIDSDFLASGRAELWWSPANNDLRKSTHWFMPSTRRSAMLGRHSITRNRSKRIPSIIWNRCASFARTSTKARCLLCSFSVSIRSIRLRTTSILLPSCSLTKDTSGKRSKPSSTAASILTRPRNIATGTSPNRITWKPGETCAHSTAR